MNPRLGPAFGWSRERERERETRRPGEAGKAQKEGQLIFAFTIIVN